MEKKYLILQPFLGSTCLHINDFSHSEFLHWRVALEDEHFYFYYRKSDFYCCSSTSLDHNTHSSFLNQNSYFIQTTNDLSIDLWLFVCVREWIDKIDAEIMGIDNKNS